jgi:hypothetical protein
MISQKRETAHLMHRNCFLDNPGFCIVTTCAIIPQRILVHICMTGNTFGFCFLKFQGGMATFTVGKLMLPRQFKLCGIVVKCHVRPRHLPAFGSMTGNTIYFKPFSMRRLGQAG